jgi:hypothetical protein
MKENATAVQFQQLLIRMMPNTFSCTGEGRLIAAVLSQAWRDSEKFESARRFFTDEASPLNFYCQLVELNAQQLREVFADHNGPYKTHLKELAA